MGLEVVVEVVVLEGTPVVLEGTIVPVLEGR
jgi:hypothetical protein